MKNIFKFLFIASLFAFVAMSCKKQEAIDYYLGGTAPVAKSDLTGTLPLSYANAANAAVTLSWTNPNYQFTTGISSQNVNYVIEIDTTGSNFTNPNLKSIGVTSDLSYTITQSQLNDIMLNQLVLAVGVPHHLEMRVKSTLINGSALLISNVLKFMATPYAIPPKVTPPGTAALGYSDGVLFLVGSATAGGWNNPVPVPAQQFTQVTPTLYTITVPLIGGQEYLFLPKNGDWSHKYACKDKTLAGLSAGGDFGADLSDNFPGPAASGNFKIDVDFQRGKFIVTQQ